MRRLSIQNLTRRKAPRYAYADIAELILPGWDISLVFVTPAKAQSVNQTLRNKTYVPNVLSYAAGTHNGEILICLAEAAKQANAYGMDAATFTLYLFIHGLLHLKGHPHGATMERRERELLALYAHAPLRAPFTHVPPHRHRNRHRHPSGEVRRRRRNR